MSTSKHAFEQVKNILGKLDCRTPNSSTSPSVGSSNPAMMEISVVLPHPLGPTSNVSSLVATSTSTS